MGIATWLYECLCPVTEGSGPKAASVLCSHAYCYWTADDDADQQPIAVPGEMISGASSKASTAVSMRADRA